MILPFYVVPQIGDEVDLFGSQWSVVSHQVPKAFSPDSCDYELQLRLAS